MNSEISQPPASLFKPINVPNKTLLGPGPSNAPPRVLAAGAMPILGHLHSEFTQIMDECKEGIQYLFQTNNRLTLAVSGTGHAAMEMACCNMIEPGDKVLIVKNGIWGSRFQDMAERQGADVVPIILEKPSQTVTTDEVKEALYKHRPQVMFITQGESSSALWQPLEGIGSLCHEVGCILIVDSVASAGGVPLFMDKWEIDVLYTGGQKCLGAPPGACPISFSERAWEKFTNRKQKPTSYYMDLSELANYWGCDGAPARRYHHTGPITSVYMLRESLAILTEEGLENSWARHRACSDQLYKGLEALGLKFYIADYASRLPTVTAVLVPEHIDWKQVSAYLMRNYRLEISGGLGPTAGKVWRVGLMGYNAKPETVQYFLLRLAEALKFCKASNPKL